MADLGYVDGKPPRERAFRAALDEELACVEAFLQPRVAATRTRRHAA